VRELLSLSSLSKLASIATRYRLLSGVHIVAIVRRLANKKHTDNERKKIMPTKNKKSKSDDFAQIIEGLTPEELSDVLTLSRLKIATQDTGDLFVTGDDWGRTPKQVKLAIGHILELVKATIPELINQRT
jgi:hypothetical protein